MREKYFTNEKAQFHYTYYPPEYAIPVGFLPTDDYVRAVREKAHKPRVGGTIIPVSDPSCEEWDAARHISALKRNVITAPQSEEALQIWIMEGDKRYQELLALSGKAAAWAHWQAFRSRSEETRSRRKQWRSDKGPTLERFIHKRKRGGA